MNKLKLSVGIGNYDRVRPIMDGEVQIDGVEPIFMNLEPEEIFFRAFRGEEFDICELSMSSFSIKTAAGNNPYIGIPVFPSRMFRHTALYIRTDKGITKPEDLRGRRIGIPEYQLTACVWGRIILELDHGVKQSEIRWVRGGLEQAGRIEKIAFDLPKDVHIEDAPIDRTLSQMLEAGEIDGILAPRAPAAFDRGDPKVGWLFPDTVEAAKAFYRRTKIFPIMHMLGVRRTLVEQHPWLPVALLKAFTKAKDIAVHAVLDPGAMKASLPFVEETGRIAKALMGDDYWSYGVEANRHLLEVFLQHHHSQGLSKRLLKPEDLFHPTTLESFKV